MSKEFEKFFYRIGLLIPRFKGYKTKEDFRESDYRIRLHAKSSFELLISKIEHSKRNVNNDDFMKFDFFQKELKIFNVKLVNQKYGYSSFFSGESLDDLKQNLKKIIAHDQAFIDLIEEIGSQENIYLELIKTFIERLNFILDKRNLLMG
jgi:hypothetical protein